MNLYKYPNLKKTKLKSSNMNTTDKQKYNIPQIERIVLDNEISLQLESNPPLGPEEIAIITPEYMNNNPISSNFG